MAGILLIDSFFIHPAYCIALQMNYLGAETWWCLLVRSHDQDVLGLFGGLLSLQTYQPLLVLPLLGTMSGFKWDHSSRILLTN